eukprot:743005-Amphidinium_carterae.1
MGGFAFLDKWNVIRLFLMPGVPWWWRLFWAQSVDCCRSKKTAFFKGPLYMERVALDELFTERKGIQQLEKGRLLSHLPVVEVAFAADS